MIDRRAAFRAERAAVLEFCESLGPADWRMNSCAEGWSIADVVAHLGAGFHAMFTSAVFTVLRTDDIEAVNDRFVDLRRYRSPAQVLSEYRRWSRVFGGLIPAMVRKPLGSVALPLAELGTFPMRLFSSAMVFDQHTHLRHDMVPALGRPQPGTDANRMAVVLEWMMAVLSNQLRATRPAWLDRPVSIALTGPGGGAWLITRSGATESGDDRSGAARITAAAAEFPSWGTRRSHWHERDVRIDGDVEYGAQLLNWVNIV